VTAGLLALELARPAALLALAFPVAVLFASRLLDRPPTTATGTLDVWERVRAALPPTAQRARRRIPPAVWALALGLALGAVALAGPRANAAGPPRVIRALVDVRPSTGLPLRDATRLEAAKSMAAKWLDEDSHGALVERIERAAPFGPDDDRSDTIWITDRAPASRPKHAGFFASGGPAVPGPIAAEGTARWDWDGERIVEVPGGAPRRTFEVRGTLPAPIARVLEAWAGARGVTARSPADEAADLVVHGAGMNASSPPHAVEAGREGWKAKGSLLRPAPSSDEAGALERWLASDDGLALVSSGAGRVHCAWTAMEDPTGDPAAFAVSWASLFDGAIRPPRGIVELGERAAAGEAAWAPPRTDERNEAAASASPLEAWTALGALLCVAGAWALARPARIG